MLHSGESIGFDLYLKNIGNADAVRVEARVTDVHGYDGTVFDVYDGWDTYPDLAAGGEAKKQNGGDFQDIYVPAFFKGTIIGDVTVKYGESALEQVLEDQVLFEVQPEAWLSVQPNDYDFGVTGTNTDIVKDIQTRNYGSTPMSVTAITPSHDDTTWTGDVLPWSLQPEESKTIQVIVDTELLDGKTISREVVVTASGRIDDAGEDDRIIITGLVSDSIPVGRISSVIEAYDPDISGDWIVYRDNRNGNVDIYAYQISKQEEIRITNDPEAQWNPYISGNLIIWKDKRNWDGQTNTAHRGVDIYGYDLSTGAEFVVSDDDMSEDIIGVDGNLVALTRVYDVLYDRDGNPRNYPQNLIVYEYLGNGEFVQRYQSGWTAGNGNETRQTVDDDGDFNEGMLIVERFEWTWRDNISGGYWSMSEGDQYLVKIDFTAGENVPERVTNGFSYPQAAGKHMFACVKDVDDDDHIMLWENNQLRQITSGDRDHADDALAIGGNFIVFDKGGLDGLFYFDIATEQEGLLTGIGYCSDTRMYGNSIVWRHCENGQCDIRYASLGVDLSIAASDIQLDVETPMEGDEINVVVKVKNISKWSTNETITLTLYDGNPEDSDSVLLSTKTIEGGISAGSEKEVSFDAFSLSEGQHTIYVASSTDPSEFSSNNWATTLLNVIDSDSNPPVISNLQIEEHQGDGDGIIGEDEVILISWELQDQSGIGSILLTVDGESVSLDGEYFALIGQLAPGEHQIMISASDADLTSEISTIDQTFDVVKSETIKILQINGTDLESGSTVDLGIIEQGRTAQNASFVFFNQGEQRLFLYDLTVPEGFEILSYENEISPGDFTIISLKARTDIIGIVGPSLMVIENSDSDSNPFLINITAELKALKADIDSDGDVDLHDAILAIQVCTGLTPNGIRSDFVSSGADVNGDNKIGLEEVVYILQKVSGLR